ncbi:MAG: glycosyltransferase family 39 protein [Ottowia sp.]|nr:glycosyltransferase family 39 protein [Ottowia sp.]
MLTTKKGFVFLRSVSLSPATIFICLGLSLLLWRLWLMAVLALADNTESRYAEIAQLTVRHGFWFMPHINLDQPFFAKPPLSTWLAALSAQWVGVSAFSLRLPSFFAGLATLGIIWRLGQNLSRTARIFSLFATIASPLFFISIGAVMTDAIQLVCVTFALWCVYQVLYGVTHQNYWRYGFWLSCGIAMLVKGLATVALIGLPLLLYALTGGGVKRMWRALWCGGGALLAILVSVPWYLMAEYAYPGFLRYFFVGEHLMRFIDPSWSGDQYGHAHRQLPGIIWGFWAIAIFPWIGIFIYQSWKTLRPSRWKNVEEKQRFLWCACLAPLLFFTVSRNLIVTYPLTALPPFSVLLAYWYTTSGEWRHTWLIGLSSVGVAITIVLGSICAPPMLEKYSTRALIQAFDAQAKPGQKLIYAQATPPYSAYFYSKDNLTVALTPDALAQAYTMPGNLIALPADLPLPEILRFRMLYRDQDHVLIHILP